MSSNKSFLYTINSIYFIPKNIVIDAEASDEIIVTQSGTLLHGTTLKIIGNDKTISVVTIT
jgi:hypothetical protein